MMLAFASLKEYLKLIENRIFSSEKIRISGDCIYDYAHSFFGDDFLSNAPYWLSLIWYTGCGLVFVGQGKKRIFEVEEVGRSLQPRITPS